ncbi:MAG TPA: RNA polymerase sigma factor SigM [Actinomycetes bacterium]|nr:RNA polymerase sigma factor SigM [Actinomycetes bacterium]
MTERAADDPARASGTDDPRSDADLLSAHSAGDHDAFGQLVRRHRDRLWAVALRTLGDREEAADALQDALVSAFRAGSSGTASSFRGESAVTTWLHRIVVNACLDRVRRRAARPADPLPEHDVPARGPDPVAARETALDVEAALAQLPVEQRAALVLVDMYGWSVQEAAEVLDCPTGTVKSRCARGRARLLPLLRPDGNQHAPGDVPPQTSTAPAYDPAEAGEQP